MGERKHKAEGGEKKDKVGQGKKDSVHVDHPILQLQQTIGNKAVTNMIQRQAASQGSTGSASSSDGEFDKLKAKSLEVDHLAKVGALNTKSVVNIGGLLIVEGNIIELGDRPIGKYKANQQ